MALCRPWLPWVRAAVPRAAAARAFSADAPGTWVDPELIGIEHFFLGCTKMADNRFFSQLRVMQTASFVPAAAIVEQIKDKVLHDPMCDRLRAVVDLDTAVITEADSVDVGAHVREGRVPSDLADGESPTEAIANRLMQRPMPAGPMWEIETYTDGADLHAVVFRWNHWIGDGVASMQCLSRLFGFPYEVTPAFQKRVPVESPTGAASFQGFIEMSRQLKQPLNLFHVDKSEFINNVDLCVATFMPVTDFDPIYRAAKAQGCSVAGLLTAVGMRTYCEALRRFGADDTVQPDQVWVKFTCATGRDKELRNSLRVGSVSVPAGAAPPEVHAALKREASVTLDFWPEQERVMLDQVREHGQVGFVAECSNPYLGAPCDLMVTPLPGPRGTILIGGTPVTAMFNTRGDTLDVIFTCTSYDGKLFTVLNSARLGGAVAPAIREIWSEKLSEACKP